MLYKLSVPISFILVTIVAGVEIGLLASFGVLCAVLAYGNHPFIFIILCSFPFLFLFGLDYIGYSIPFIHNLALYTWALIVMPVGTMGYIIGRQYSNYNLSDFLPTLTTEKAD